MPHNAVFMGASLKLCQHHTFEVITNTYYLLETFIPFGSGE